MRKYREKKNELIMDIINNYHYLCWGKTHKRIDEIPTNLQVVYYRFGQLAEFPATSEQEEKKQLAELKQIRKKLKKYYRKGEKI